MGSSQTSFGCEHRSPTHVLVKPFVWVRQSVRKTVELKGRREL